MIPCAFDDLGKKSKDLLEKDFPLDRLKFDVRTTTKHDIDLTVSGDHPLGSHPTGLSGSIESKFKIPKFNATLTEKWTSASLLTCKFAVDDKLLQGLKTSLESTFDPSGKKLSAAFNTAYQRPYVNLKLDAARLTDHPLVTSSLVLGVSQVRGLHFGGQASYDTATAAIASCRLGMSYNLGDFVLHGGLRDFQEINTSFYQLVNPRVETAISVNYSHASHTSNFALVGRYFFDSKSWVKAKVDNASLVTASYGFVVADGVKVIIGGRLDGKNLQGGKHSVGLSLEFDA